MANRHSIAVNMLYKTNAQYKRLKYSLTVYFLSRSTF